MSHGDSGFGLRWGDSPRRGVTPSSPSPQSSPAQGRGRRTPSANRPEVIGITLTPALSRSREREKDANRLPPTARTESGPLSVFVEIRDFTGQVSLGCLARDADSIPGRAANEPTIDSSLSGSYTSLVIHPLNKILTAILLFAAAANAALG